MEPKKALKASLLRVKDRILQKRGDNPRVRQAILTAIGV